MDNKERLDGAIRHIRMRVAAPAWAAVLVVAIFFPSGAIAGGRSAHLTWIAAAVLTLAVNWRIASASKSTQLKASLVSLALSLVMVNILAASVESGGPGSYALSYVAAALIFAAAMAFGTAAWATWFWFSTPLIFVAVFPQAALRDLGDFAIRYWFVYIVALWSSMSINAYLRRTQEDLEDAMTHPSLRESTREVLRAALTLPGRCGESHDHSSTEDSPTIRFGDEYTLLMRRRSLENQFTEWRARSWFGHNLRLNSADAEKLRRLNYELLAPERSPLSILVYQRGDAARLMARAAFPSADSTDLPPADHGGASEIYTTAFGRVLAVDIPDAGAPTSTSDPKGTAYLNDLVGGGVAGDNYRFCRAILWMMALAPIAACLQQAVLIDPPGRDLSDGWTATTFAVCCALSTFISVSTVVSLRRDESVVARIGWHRFVGFASMLPFALFGIADPTGVLWEPSVNWSFRFVHPFLFVSLALGLLLGLWAANAPRTVPSSTRQSKALTLLGVRALEIRSIGLAIAVIGGLTAVGVISSGLHSERPLSLYSVLVQIGVWCLPGIVGALVGVFLLRRGFRAITEVAFAFQSGRPTLGWKELLDAVGWNEQCAGRKRAAGHAATMTETRAEDSMIPAALSMLDGGASVVENGALVATTSARDRDLSDKFALIERTVLAEGFQAPTVVEREGYWTVSVPLNVISDGTRLAKLLCGHANPRRPAG